MAETEHTEQGGKAAAAEDVAQVAGGGYGTQSATGDVDAGPDGDADGENPGGRAPVRSRPRRARANWDRRTAAKNGVDNAVRADEVLVGGKWPTEALYYVAGSKLRGSAATFFASMEAIAATADRTYDALATRLKQQYGTELTEAATVNKLLQRKKQPTEMYREYGMALRQAAEGVQVGEQFFIEAFQCGLGDFTGSMVRNWAPNTLMDAVHCATLARGHDGRGAEKPNWTRGRGVRAPEAAPVNLVQTTGEVGGAAVNPDVKGECTVA
ncbi:hypothetical protein P43SY_006341 [Pythium insidiosum]|uniref:Retrotransposon gag domain-containing protein n=1 Tax=Pythium insidiosum TaxID=114742 RepID=A0AAD5Q3W7_PYTIN|nr:hypothetical protein P43SY_006341 [Pythium insidiosum]